MLYNWDKSLETGNKTIDRQHQSLIETLNKLIIANNEGAGAAVLKETLEFLANYVEQHFKDEEELQIKYNYPKYAIHKQTHDNFRVVVHDLMSRLNNEGYTHALMNLTLTTMADWLIVHIKDDDLRLAIYIQQVNSQDNCC